MIYNICYKGKENVGDGEHVLVFPVHPDYGMALANFPLFPYFPVRGGVGGAGRGKER